MKNWISRIVGGAFTATVLAAVAAFAIYFSDLSVFSESARLADVPSNSAVDDAVILNNWQFTDSQFDNNNNKDGNGDNSDDGSKDDRKTKEDKETKKMSKHTGH
jgi:hypothetical protein